MNLQALQKQTGDQLQLLRKARGLTQKELSELLQVSTSYIIGVEQGRKNLTLAQMQRITQALGGQIQISVKL